MGEKKTLWIKNLNQTVCMTLIFEHLSIYHMLQFWKGWGGDFQTSIVYDLEKVFSGSLTNKFQVHALSTASHQLFVNIKGRVSLRDRQFFFFFFKSDFQKRKQKRMKMLGSAKVTQTMYNYARSNIVSALSSMHLSGKLFPALPFIVTIYMKLQMEWGQKERKRPFAPCAITPYHFCLQFISTFNVLTSNHLYCHNKF